MGPLLNRTVRAKYAENASRLKNQALGEASKLTGLAGNLKGGLEKAKSLLNNGFNLGGNAKEVAAKLANKSPFDMDLISPTAHLGKENSKFNYGTLVYPQETQNLGDGHYMLFDIIPLQNALVIEDEKATKVEGAKTTKAVTGASKPLIVGEGRRKKFHSAGKMLPNKPALRKQTSGMGKNTSFHNTITDSIVLYTPETGNTFDYGVTYGDVNTGMISNIVNFIDSVRSGNMSFADAAGQGLGTMGRQLLETAITAVLPGFGAMMQKKLGTAINPNQELTFQSVPFRSFNFSFNFAPRNKTENDTCHNIISLFKFHMHPEDTKIGRLAIPSEFQITYMYRDKENAYIPKISRCVLETMKVDYSPDSKFHTFKGDEQGAAPIFMKLDLSFKELEIMTKDTIALGH